MYFQATAPTISHHLAVLKQAGLIVNTKEGKYIHYELNLSVVEELFKWVASLKGEKIDEKKMKHIAMPIPILILSFLPLLMVTMLYHKLPEMVPVQWTNGAIRYGEKWKLLPISGMSILIGVMMPILGQISPFIYDLHDIF